MTINVFAPDNRPDSFSPHRLSESQDPPAKFPILADPDSLKAALSQPGASYRDEGGDIANHAR